jgi:hypothetical protein
LPALDYYHNTVKRALVKDGWIIVDDSVKVEIGRRRLWIDLMARHLSRDETILIEVKGFEKSPSLIGELAQAAGQYLIYQEALAEINNNLPIYLAVPDAAQQGILNELIGQRVISRIAIKILAFDPMAEEITRWLP